MDFNGVVNIITFSNVMMLWSADVKCVLNGSAGQMMALSILGERAGVAGASPSASSKLSGLLALSLLESTFIVALEAEAQVLFKWPKPEGLAEEAVPTLSWNRVSMQSKPMDLLTATLARGWGHTLSS